ncbi:uncharacterized protein TrAtP1_006499 [Trichoderma atroviride]|uniref:uncharacterized protein n=1 Tax=Hypocrea atroviridis TaxID=63577 RepID=UPI003318094E|nr:hypothetical protein TrAtP1_006499 [Trichoderma atroviride]
MLDGQSNEAAELFSARDPERLASNKKGESVYNAGVGATNHAMSGNGMRRCSYGYWKHKIERSRRHRTPSLLGAHCVWSLAVRSQRVPPESPPTDARPLGKERVPASQRAVFVR